MKELELEGNPFGDTGVEYICRENSFPFVDSLDLRTKEHETTGIFPTSKGEYWYCELTAKSVHSILQKDWKNLSRLKIRIKGKEVVC